MTTTAATINSKNPAQKQELIAANIKLLTEQLETGYSEALTSYLNAMSRFRNYSVGNVLEIARQMPNATRVAGFWTWKSLGRNVKAGQKGIRILAPLVGVRRREARRPRGISLSRMSAFWSVSATPTSSTSHRPKAPTCRAFTKSAATPERTWTSWPRSCVRRTSSLPTTRT
jgi:hypothetical protein